MKKKFLYLLPLVASLMLCLCFAASCGEEETAHTTHSWGEYTVTQAATCTDTGWEEHTCTVCGTTEKRLISALGHKWDEGTVQKAPTCEDDGVLIKTCKNDPSHTKTSPLTKLGHDWQVQEVIKAATCTERGEQLMVCKNDASHTKTMDITPKGHNWTQWSREKEPDCTNQGLNVRNCKDCEEKEEEPIPALGHVWGDTITPGPSPTCSERGYSTHTCTVCGEEGKLYVARLGHDWGDWSVTEAATCEKEGVRTHTCKVCRTSKEEKIPALGHEWTFTEVTPATQDTEGKETGVCANCEETCERTIPMLSAPTGVYRIVVSKTNGRMIPTWKPNADGVNYRYYWDWSRNVYYTTEVTLTNSKGEFVYRGNMIVENDAREEVEPHLELVLPIDDYTVTLGDIPVGYIYRDSYMLKKDSYVKYVPDESGKSDQEETDDRVSAKTNASDPIDVNGEKASDKIGEKLAGSLRIVLTSEMADGRLHRNDANLTIDTFTGDMFRGAIIPDFSLTTVDNETITLSSLLEEKQIVILDVYFFSCAYCQKAAPDFVRFAKRFKDDVAVICLNSGDGSVDVAKKIYDRSPYNYPDWFYCVMTAQSGFYLNIEHTPYNGLGAPTQVVIDKGFCVTDIFTGYRKNGAELLFQNLPDGFNRDFEREMSNLPQGQPTTISTVPAMLPEKKEIFD